MSQRPRADLLLVGASELVTCAGSAPAAGAAQSEIGLVERGAVAAEGGVITWVGPESRLAAEVDVGTDAERIDVGGRAVLPGLVDAHTHLAWGGERIGEFQRRLAGVSYAEIAAEGGGILSTVAATRETSLEVLAADARARIERMRRYGTTALEAKSGYGLDRDTELRLLEASLLAGQRAGVPVATTFLGAHTLPREARADAGARARQLDLICDELIPEVAERGLARFVDVFVDEHAFTVKEAERVLRRGIEAGLLAKIHAAQLAPDGGLQLAAALGARSADHLEHASDADLEALAASGTVGVLLPGATLFLRMQRYADARRMVEAGVPVAVATDLNPGSCPSPSMPFAMQLAALTCGLSVDEALVAATRNAAYAAGLEESCGSLEPGKRMDALVLDAPSRAALFYWLADPPIHATISGGRIFEHV